MSIYIKGVEMPTKCEECEWSTTDRSGFFGCRLTENIVIRKREKDRPDWCPLVPVPEHGRLIDADAFCEKILEIVERQKYDDFYAKSFSVGAILREVVNELKGVGLDGFGNAPTIIPADPAEEGEG